MSMHSSGKLHVVLLICRRLKCSNKPSSSSEGRREKHCQLLNMDANSTGFRFMKKRLADVQSGSECV